MSKILSGIACYDIFITCELCFHVAFDVPLQTLRFGSNIDPIQFDGYFLMSRLLRKLHTISNFIKCTTSTGYFTKCILITCRKNIYDNNIEQMSFRYIFHNCLYENVDITTICHFYHKCLHCKYFISILNIITSTFLI